jgi:hypothetical protein
MYSFVLVAVGPMGWPLLDGNEIEIAVDHLEGVEELDGLRIARVRVLAAARAPVYPVYEEALSGSAA